MDTALPIEENVPLAPLTTLQVGGPARYVASCRGSTDVEAALVVARQQRLATFVLGGGSNLLVADEGFDGLVVQLADEALEFSAAGERVRLRAGAGLEWDRLVAATVDEGLAGLECLSGIPGRVGAAPMQNIGAYGQEAGECLWAVEVLERQTGRLRTLSREQCGLGYRTSCFKTAWRDRFVVLKVVFELRRERCGAVRYPDLRQLFGKRPAGSGPSLDEVRRAVLAIRREKSMLLSADDPNRRSAGSFFLNPIVSRREAERVREVAKIRAPGREMPSFPAPRDQIKLSAAWLIEIAGFNRGHHQGRAGLSSRHVLAVINRGGATAAELLALAAEIRRTVQRVWGLELNPEPYFLGFHATPSELLS